jgi:hypothetical protein
MGKSNAMSDYTEDGKYRRSNVNRGALISVDNAGLQAYKTRKLRQEGINRVIDEHDSLVEDVALIKSMLVKLLERTE